MYVWACVYEREKEVLYMDSVQMATGEKQKGFHLPLSKYGAYTQDK